MTLFLDPEDVTALCSATLCMKAARGAVAAEKAGTTILPPRLDVDLPTGFLRAMPAALGDVMGLKVMTLVKGLGTRYLVLVYSQPTGELIAMIDAAEVTRWRTAATTAVAGEMLAPDGTTVLGLVGTGFEAEGHLRLFAELWPLERVAVYSRSAQRRDAFAARMSAELRTDVRAVDSAKAAIAAGPVSVLATKSAEPVVDGDDFPPGAVVLSIGSTRPDLRELDNTTMSRGAILLVDDPVQVCSESGDIMDALASGALHSEHVVSMAAIDGGLSPTDEGRDLLLFKSVGTAVHDLALALAVLEAARESGLGRDLGELTLLKPFADTIAALPGSST